MKKRSLFSTLLVLFFCLSVSIAINFAKKDAKTALALAPEDLFIKEGSAVEIISNKDFPEFSDIGNGIGLYGNGSDSRFRFLNVIDLNGITKADNLIEFQVDYNENNANSGFEKVYINLIDINDEKNILSIHEYQVHEIEAWTKQLSYFQAGFNGQFYSMTNNILQINKYGSAVYGSYNGLSKKIHNYQFDYANAQFYTNNLINTTKQTMLIDINDPNVFGMDTWKGFSTGEVYLEVVLGNMKEKSGIIVSEVAGNKLSGNTITDIKSPFIRIENQDKYASVYPDGKKDAPYRIPDAYGLDVIDGKTAVTFEIYLENSIIQPAVTDGKFTPDTSGNYIIVYTSADVSNNTSAKTIHFSILDYILELSASLNTVPIAYVGYTYFLPEITVKGGSDGYIKSTEVEYNGKLIKGDYNNGIYLNRTGSIKIKVVAADYLSETIKTFEIPVYIDSKPVLYIEPLPYAVKANSTVAIPNFYAVDYNVSGEKNNTFTAIYVNGKKLGNDRLYSVKDEEILFIEYVAGHGINQSRKVYKLPVLQISSPQDYIITNDTITYSLTNDGLELHSSKNFTAALPFPVVADGLNVSFAIGNAAYLPGYVDICLEDYGDSLTRIFFRLTAKSDSESYLQVNGEGMKFTISGSFFDASKMISVVYRNDAFRVLSNNKRIASIETDANGRTFKGFSSGLARVSIRAGNVNGNVCVTLYQVGNQVLNSYYDQVKTEPQLIFDKPMTNSKIGLNEKFSVHPAHAFGVLSLYHDVSVRVVKPDGTDLLSNTVINETKEFTATEYGTYRIIYTATDDEGNEHTSRYNVVVEDSIPPKIELLFGVYEEISLGNSVKIPEATVTDNIDKNPVLTITVIELGSNYAYSVTQGENFVPDKKGEYKLIFYAFDSKYNTSRIEILFKAV